jgi:hypothetical protein
MTQFRAGSGLNHAAAWRLITAVLGVLTSTAAVAEAIMSGTMKPLGSVRFAPDNDVRCLLSALETGDPATVLDLDPEGTRRMPADFAAPSRTSGGCAPAISSHMG